MWLCVQSSGTIETMLLKVSHTQAMTDIMQKWLLFTWTGLSTFVIAICWRLFCGGDLHYIVTMCVRIESWALEEPL